MIRPLWLLVSMIALAATSCAEVTYRPRASVPGDPSFPPTRLERVTPAETEFVPGLHRQVILSGPYARPVVTREGLQDVEKIEPSSEVVDDRTVLAVRVQFDRPTEIRRMIWTAPDAPRCAGGHPALRVSIDDRVHWERPLVIEGEHVVSGRFDQDPALLLRPSVVDLLLVGSGGTPTTTTCVRIPATAFDLGLASDKRWSFGARVSGRRSLPFTSTSTAVIGASLGRWFGPVRLGVEGSIGGTDETSADAPSGTAWCWLDPGRDCTVVDLGIVALESSGIARRWGRLALGWSFAYEVLIAGLHRTPPEGGPRVDSHMVSGGPRAAVQLLRLPAPDVLEIDPASPTSGWGVEFFAATPAWPQGPGGGPRASLGISLLLF